MGRKSYGEEVSAVAQQMWNVFNMKSLQRQPNKFSLRTSASKWQAISCLTGPSMTYVKGVLSSEDDQENVFAHCERAGVVEVRECGLRLVFDVVVTSQK